MPKSICLIGKPGSGKTVVLETLPGGTVLFNFDAGGYESLKRPTITIDEWRQRLANPKPGVRPTKVLKFAPTFREWLLTKDTLQPNEILVVDYQPRKVIINPGYSINFDSQIFMNFALDVNSMDKMKGGELGICHVANDSLTGMQWAVLEAMVNLRGSTAGGYVGTDQPTYGKAIEKIIEIIDTSCHLPFDYILTAHVEADKDELLGRITEQISIYGKKLPETIASMITDIYYAEAVVSGQSVTYTWSSHPQQFLKTLRTRSFDNLTAKVPASFTLYKGMLVCP